MIFNDEPDVHLIGHRNYQKGTVNNAPVAADCDEVALFLIFSMGFLSVILGRSL